MILPISLPFNRSGLPGGGVPAFTIDPVTGDIIGAGSGEVHAGGGSGSGGSSGWGGGSGWGAGDGANDTSLALWDGAVKPADGSGGTEDILDTGSLLHTHGREVWNRPGSYRDESLFDKWRRAGKPTRCGMGTTQEVLDAIAAGTMAASGRLQYGGYYPQGYPQQYPQVAIGGSASPAAWILGAVAVGLGILWIVKR